MLAAISVDALVHAVVMFLVIAAIFGLLWWLLLSVIPFPDPVKRWVKVVLIVVMVLVVIGYLLDLSGHPVLTLSR
jgi:heme A synthase